MSRGPRTNLHSLRDAIGRADADRFVGRAAEMEVVAELLSDQPTRLLFVHGPGGIGKSTLLRAAVRRAADEGFDVVAFDSRQPIDELAAEIDALAERRSPRVLVVIDEIENLGSRLAEVRGRLLDVLPASGLLAVGGRSSPDSSWWADGLDAVFSNLALGPLDDTEAAELLALRSVDERERPGIVAWAQGSPLALTVASSGSGALGVSAGAEEMETKLTVRLAGHPILDASSDLVEVAALAPAVDARLLAAALPSRSTRDGMRRLAALPVVEQVGGRLVLHPVLAAAIRARLEATAPQRKRILTRRIAEHLAGRARLGDIQALTELSQFIGEPGLRQAISNQPSASLVPGRPRRGELAGFAKTHGFDVGSDWPEIARWFEDGLDHDLCIRRRDGSIVLYAAFSATADLVDRGPVSQSLRLAAEAAGVDGKRSFAGIVLFADEDEHALSEAARLSAGALMHRHGIADMQAVLIHFPSPDRQPVDTTSAIASPLPDDLPRPVALTDFRPVGAVGFVEQVVLGELGFAPRGRDVAPLLDIDDDEVRQVRLRERLAEVFDESQDDQRMRRAIELVHISPRHSEQACLDALNVSRSSWFRLLRQARERVLSGPD